MRVLVVGGTGFLGSRTVAALRRVPGAEVAVGSRSEAAGRVRIDLADYGSRTAMEGFDFVVDCADGLEAPPDRAAEYCLLRGITFVETSAAAGVVERLWRSARAVPDPAGAVVVSAGLFPGVSNLLAAKLHAEGPARRLEVGVRYSPLSQAGRGVCRSMASACGRPAARYEAGERVLDPPLTVGGVLPFFRGERRVMGVGMPESTMLHWSCRVPSTGSFLAPVPPVPLTVQRLLTLFMPWGLLRLRPAQWCLGAGLWLLRAGGLRWRRAAVEIAAVCDREPSGAYGRHACVRVDGGFEGAAHAIAASVALLAEKRPLAPGVHLIDQVLSFDEVVARMRRLGDGEVRVEVLDRGATRRAGEP